MKIVKLEHFLALPPGTLFAKYVPCVFEELTIKGETLPATNDFCYQDIISVDAGACGDSADILFLAEEGESVSLDLNCQGRDGCFEPEQLFAVYERHDVYQLIARLQQALSDSDIIV